MSDLFLYFTLEYQVSSCLCLLLLFTDPNEAEGGRSKRHLSTSSETDYTTVKYDLFAMSVS